MNVEIMNSSYLFKLCTIVHYHILFSVMNNFKCNVLKELMLTRVVKYMTVIQRKDQNFRAAFSLFLMDNYVVAYIMYYSC